MDLSCIYLAVRLSLALQEMAILHHKSAYQEFTKIFFQGCIAECFTEMTQYILLSIYLDKKGIHFKVKWKKNAHKDTSLPRDLGFRLGCLWPFALTTVTWFYNWVITYIKAEVYVESKWKQGSGSLNLFCRWQFLLNLVGFSAWINSLLLFLVHKIRLRYTSINTTYLITFGI